MNFIKSCILSTEKKEEEEIPQLPVESPDVKESGFKHLFEIQRISKKQLYDRNPEFVAKYAEEKLKQFTLVVCGAPKTGKSTLINAICGKAVADTSDSLDALTTDTKCYPVEGAYPVIEEEQDYQKKFRINIYDTKGITSWDLSIIDILKSTNPICMIYCATPGTFADLRMVEELIKECVRLKIFVALVCTNMWTNDDEHRETIMQEFDNVLKVK
ncbi:unnamed protein product [Didymodactylos carnosus]|uniref:G domain-containing protein n=1 Tax=Didymodactylos carnosus TaxID=1234261 RepID=A0A815NP41_9BILA|nr:unnamed protein product [Didymodactylos carnosus]CAF4315853.1 unnamed protein product [Didymodactylos carnosus]